MIRDPVRLWSTSWEDRQTRARHGANWTTNEMKRLDDLFRAGMSLKSLCETLERPKNGVIPKLIQLNLIESGGDGYYYCKAIPGIPTSTETKEPETMSNSTQPIAVIEAKTMIYGQDATTLTDNQIFEFIGKLENSIKRWDGIENKPKKLGAMITQMNLDVAALVAYVDGR